MCATAPSVKDIDWKHKRGKWEKAFLPLQDFKSHGYIEATKKISYKRQDAVSMKCFSKKKYNTVACSYNGSKWMTRLQIISLSVQCQCVEISCLIQMYSNNVWSQSISTDTSDGLPYSSPSTDLIKLLQFLSVEPTKTGWNILIDGWALLEISTNSILWLPIVCVRLWPQMTSPAQDVSTCL